MVSKIWSKMAIFYANLGELYKVCSMISLFLSSSLAAAAAAGVETEGKEIGSTGVFLGIITRPTWHP